MGQTLRLVHEAIGVDTSLLEVKGEKSYTGRCVCLVDKTGQRTMRPSLEDAIRLQPDEVTADQLRGVKWVVVNGYSYYGQGLMEATVAAATAAGCKVAMHLASFEIVRKFREPMSRLLASGAIHAVFANEDEARELVGGGVGSDSIETDTKIEAALAKLAEWCDIAVVTLGDKGCVAMRGTERVEQKAFKGFDGGGHHGRGRPVQRGLHVRFAAQRVAAEVLRARVPVRRGGGPVHGRGDLRGRVDVGSRAHARGKGAFARARQRRRRAARAARVLRAHRVHRSRRGLLRQRETQGGQPALRQVQRTREDGLGVAREPRRGPAAGRG